MTPCGAGELGLVPDHTPERPDGHENRGKCGGRPHGIFGEADPDCHPTHRCHDCLGTMIVKGESVNEKDGDDGITAHGAGSPPLYMELS